MQKDAKSSGKIENKSAAVCGLFCEACTLFIANTEDLARLEGLVARFHLSTEAAKFNSIRNNYMCPQWASLNTAYDLKCRKCGLEPSCKYVRKHNLIIEKQLKNI